MVPRPIRQLVDGRGVVFADQQDLERPHRPKRNYGGKAFVFPDQAWAAGLRPEIVAQKAGAPLAAVLGLGPMLLLHFVGNPLAGPDLAMGVRVAGAHEGT